MVKEDVRLHPRRKMRLDVEYSVLSGSGMLKIIPARTLDFSISGARIETKEQLEEGDRLSVRIEVPDLNAFEVGENGNKSYVTTVIMCFGTVRWVKKVGEKGINAGIRFRGLSFTDRNYLKRLLEEESLEAWH